MTEDQVKHLVDRFLCWKLPKDFNPDCGISFDRKYQDDHSPTGTNVLDAMQAAAMVRYMLEGLPDADVIGRLRHALTVLLKEAENFSVSGVAFDEECFGHKGPKLARDALDAGS